MKKLLYIITLAMFCTGCTQQKQSNYEETNQYLVETETARPQIPQEYPQQEPESEEYVEIFLNYTDFTEQEVRQIKQRFVTLGNYMDVNENIDQDFINAFAEIKSQADSQTDEQKIEQSIYNQFIEQTDQNFANTELGYLMLSNKTLALPYDYEPQNTRVVNVWSNKTIYVEDQTAQQAEKMFESAKADGVNIMLVSGYRNFSYQAGLFDRKVSAIGFTEANKIVAIPGQSEHQTGFVIDVSCNEVGGSLVTKFEDTKEFAWLYENCADYGFILRYGKDQVEITGYSYEPWHYRYVGDPEIARYIMNNNLTLEEYHELLQENA